MARFSSLCFAAILGASLPCLIASPPQLDLNIRPHENEIELSWPAAARPRVSGLAVTNWNVQASDDLRQWQSVIRLDPAAGPRMGVRVSKMEGRQFFRVLAQVSPSLTTLGGAEVFGYEDFIAEKLSELGQLSVAEFASRFRPSPTLDGISWDVTTAAFWDEFNAPPRSKPRHWSEPLYTFDFRLTEDEFEMFRRNGFVVSERLGAHSFAEIYYRIFYSDLPVFITTDSILQAWHRSYAAILAETEESAGYQTVSNLVAALRNEITSFSTEFQNSALSDSLRDVDYFLAVADSLLNGAISAPMLGPNARVSETVNAINAGIAKPFLLFDRRHGPVQPVFDFSQFVVRGYYTKSARLSGYFRTVKWLGLADFRIAGNPDDPSSRELGSAIILNDLLNRSGFKEEWARFDRLIRELVGVPDALQFAEFDAFLTAHGITSPARVSDARGLENLQQQILSGNLGVQAIAGHVFFSPLGPEQLVLPRAFAVLAPRFSLDGWALSQTVFDRIIWDTNGIPEAADKVQRRIPSALDVSFAVMGNNHAVPSLTSRMQNSNGVPFRDGLPYQHNLAAVRLVVDEQLPGVWRSSVHSMWLAALRELSNPVTAPEFPEAMRTRAWSHKTLTTQLASWTQLRHNNQLYLKEAYSPDTVCFYPAGFVEPIPAFWERMQELAQRLDEVVRAATFAGSYSVTNPLYNPADSWSWEPRFVTHSLPAIQSGQTNFLARFAETMSRLRLISEKHLTQTPLEPDEEEFLRNTIEYVPDYYGVRTFTGWYPQLFHQALAPLPPRAEQLHSSDQWDALVTSFHTDAPSPMAGDPGGVVHAGVGNVNMLLIAVDNGPDRMMYAGPVLSFYEFTAPAFTRHTNEEWKQRILDNALPATPEWTLDYLTPGAINIPWYAK